jgi:hypothetical protein
MKKLLLSALSICLVFQIVPQPAAAADTCLATFLDSEWSSGQPAAVTKFISDNSKDYAGGLSFNEWEYAPEKWWKYDAQAPNLNPSIAGRLRALNSIEAIPFSLGAKNGDKIRSTYIYSGRNCATRTIVVNPSKIFSEANLLTYENDYENFVKTISKDFNYENEIRGLLPKKIELKVETSQGEAIIANQTRIDDVFEFTEVISEDLATRSFFYFPDDCFSIPAKTDFHFNWWNGGARTFSKAGNCAAQLYFVAELPQTRKLVLYNYGNVIFAVAPNSKTIASGKSATITCIKGKLTKKVTGINPKCPAGYKVKK